MGAYESYLSHVHCLLRSVANHGGENGPVTVAAFKAADSALCGSNGGFDSHTPPPTSLESILRLRILFQLAQLY